MKKKQRARRLSSPRRETKTRTRTARASRRSTKAIKRTHRKTARTAAKRVQVMAQRNRSKAPRKGRGQSARRVKVPSATGMRGLAGLSRKDRSIVGRYWNAVHSYVARGDTSALTPFVNARLTDANGRRIVLLTDLQTLDRLAAAGVLSFESIYGRRV